MKEKDQAVAAATDEQPVLKGTFAAVLLLGGFLAVTWFAVFLLFLSRQ
nr:cytochrome c oxidase subunit 2A [Paenibacillus aestuarii]